MCTIGSLGRHVDRHLTKSPPRVDPRVTDSGLTSFQIVGQQSVNTSAECSVDPALFKYQRNKWFEPVNYDHPGECSPAKDCLHLYHMLVDKRPTLDT